MTQLKSGETYRVAFLLYDATGAATVDTTAGNYTWPLQRNGAAVASPSISITNPSGNVHVLEYTPSQTGQYTFSELTHATSGYLTNLGGGAFMVRTNSVDSLAAALAAEVTVPAGSNEAPGVSLHLYRNKDFTVTFALTDSAGAARDLTGSTFRFAIGDRTEASDTAFFNKAPISPDSPATDGLVTVTLTDTETAVAAFDSRAGSTVWYELEETDSSSLKHTRAIGRITISRDIPAP